MNKIILEVNTYSHISLLDFIKENNLIIYDFLGINEFTYQISCNFKTYRIIKKNYKNIKIVSTNNIKMLLLQLISNKLVVFYVILSILCYFFLSNRIFVININVSTPYLNNLIKDEMEENNLIKYKMLPSTSKLKDIEKNIINRHNDKFQLFSIVKKGNYIIVNYEKRKSRLSIESKKGKIYSKKDAVISKILISSGNVLVKENQYVKENDLLVDDIVINNNASGSPLNS